MEEKNKGGGVRGVVGEGDSGEVASEGGGECTWRERADSDRSNLFP